MYLTTCVETAYNFYLLCQVKGLKSTCATILATFQLVHPKYMYIVQYSMYS